MYCKIWMLPLIGLLGMALVCASIAAAEDFSNYVDQQGAISMPDRFRTQWSHLGSWIVPSEDARQPGFHDVYIQPKALKAYRKKGSFPDGAAVIREVRSVESSQLTTGPTSWGGEVKAWYVMIKDRKGRFSDHPSWGHGWGWALFKPGNPDRNVSSNYQTDCFGCHVPAKQTDFVNVRGYPPMR